MIIANLSSQAEVKRAANEFLALEKPLDILLNNAGIMNRERNETVDGLKRYSQSIILHTLLFH